MLNKALVRILHFTYPLLVSVAAIAAWSATSLSEASHAPPPGNGLNFSWKPSLITQSASNQDTDFKQNKNRNN